MAKRYTITILILPIITLGLGWAIGAMNNDFMVQIGLCLPEDPVCVVRNISLFIIGLIFVVFLVAICIDLFTKKRFDIKPNNSIVRPFLNDQVIGISQGVGFEIRNKYNTRYTDCTGVIEEIYYMMAVDGKLIKNLVAPFSGRPIDKSLVWNNPLNTVCKLDITAQAKENILFLANAITGVQRQEPQEGEEPKTISIFKFSFCDSSEMQFNNPGLYKIRIRINAITKDNEITQRFDTYFFYNFISHNKKPGFVHMDQVIHFLVEGDPLKNQTVNDWFFKRKEENEENKTNPKEPIRNASEKA